MPRLVFEEPKGGPAKTESAEDRTDSKRDNVVVVLKAATFALVIALVGAAILLTTAGGEEDPQARTPAVPEIAASNVPNPTTTTSTSSPLGEIVAPEVRTQTAEITPSVQPTTTQPAPPPGNTRPPDRFAVVGKPCPTVGEYSFTERYEAVMCVERRGGKAVWRPVFG